MFCVIKCNKIECDIFWWLWIISEDKLTKQLFTFNFPKHVNCEAQTSV